MKLNEIGFPAITEERASTVSSASNLSRCELIVTNRCNLACKYCKKNYLTLTDVSKELGHKIIAGWVENNVSFVNFSGGEPLYNLNLPDFVDHLAQSGVPFISLSTNGTLPVNDYFKLINLGVTHLAISIDGMNAESFDKMVGDIPGTWKDVVYNIKQLSPLVYVTASTVFNKDNYNEADEIIKFIDSLGVADIRFSTATQVSSLIPKLEAIPDYIMEKHPLLKYRVNRLKNGQNMRGAATSKKCWLPLDDIVATSEYHYPCSMQLRELGVSIGKILDSNGNVKPIEKIRQERANWINNFDCRNNKICQKYCMDFIIAYNNRVSEIRCVK